MSQVDSGLPVPNLDVYRDVLYKLSYTFRNSFIQNGKPEALIELSNSLNILSADLDKDIDTLLAGLISQLKSIGNPESLEYELGCMLECYTFNENRELELSHEN